MDKTRFLERNAAFQQALTKLQLAVNQQPANEFIRDSVIQRFEFTYELSWKVMKLWLESKDIDVRNPKDTLAAALVQGLIDDGNGWTQLHTMRNLTSHTYDEELAKEVYDYVCQQGVQLFEALAAKLQQLRF